MPTWQSESVESDAVPGRSRCGAARQRRCGRAVGKLALARAPQRTQLVCSCATETLQISQLGARGWARPESAVTLPILKLMYR
eukprot:4714680-Pleurochrysis_carterae.AAC.5